MLDVPRPWYRAHVEPSSLRALSALEKRRQEAASVDDGQDTNLISILQVAVNSAVLSEEDLSVRAGREFRHDATTLWEALETSNGLADPPDRDARVLL
jgi:hypothetical protein